MRVDHFDKMRKHITAFDTNDAGPEGIHNGISAHMPQNQRDLAGGPYSASSIMTFTDPGTLNDSAAPSIFAIGMMPGEGIDSPSWW